jgi:ADP-ribose pyrophosphatase YjhB (NUDIX family)
METSIPKWLEWAREIQALCQTGLAYTRDPFDLHRYQRMREIAAEIVHSQSGMPQETVREDFIFQAGYATPKIDVRAAVVQDGKILLVQEGSDRGWSLPGGWGDVGVPPAKMVAREVREESGYRVKVEKAVGIFDLNLYPYAPLHFYHVYKLVFLCTITGGKPRPGDDMLAVAFFDRKKLPPLSTTRTHKKMIEEVFAHCEHPERPTYFD